MRQLFLSLVLTIGVCASALAADVDSARYREKALSALSNTEYKVIKITGPISGYCTIAKGIFDWNASNFIARDSNGKLVQGSVCGGKVYLREADIATL